MEPFWLDFGTFFGRFWACIWLLFRDPFAKDFRMCFDRFWIVVHRFGSFWDRFWERFWNGYRSMSGRRRSRKLASQRPAKAGPKRSGRPERGTGWLDKRSGVELQKLV